MKFTEYVEDQITLLLVCLLYVLAQSTILYFLGNNLSIVILLAVIWLLIYSAYLILDYHHKNKRFKMMNHIAEQLDQKYLLHEVLPRGGDFEEEHYKKLLYMGNKSMIEQVSSISRERLDYQEYVEQWVHEIKTPIAAMKLWIENQQVERKRDLQQQLERTENYVEQALFYARSENIAKDVCIHNLNISDCIHDSIAKNKYLCLQTHVRIQVDSEPHFVFGDEKWIVFILNQIIENAIKYRKSSDACIIIRVKTDEHSTIVNIKDNGRGICSQDLPRIFEKGFTGTNGRNANQHATGIGLYLCKRLCSALEIEMKVDSIVDEYTSVKLIFKC